MEPLNLRIQPPRSPYQQLGGLVLLPRTVDKMRAQLPGGDIGLYQIEGFSSLMLEQLSIAEDDLRAIVALASSDEDVAAWVLKHTDAETRERVNARFTRVRIADLLHREGFTDRYPQARELPPETPAFELLEDDDRRLFAS